VLRGAYGIFTSSFQGNIAASSIIGPPYWSYETPSFSKQSMQKWETAFPLVPNTFSPPGVAAPAWNAKSQKTHEWNLAVEQTLPLASTLTLSYVGNHVFDGLSGQSYDDVPAGQYSDLQAARPIPGLSSVVLFQNMGDSWYNGLQAKWERRFTNGLTFTGSYAFSKLMVDNLASCVYCTVQPWTPKGYNRGRSSNDITHILTVNSVYDLPVGRGRKYFNDMNRTADLLLGGWELSGILSYASGAPLSFDVPGATLGNGYDTRPDLVSSLTVHNRSAQQWFNPDALAAPDPYTYGNSGLNILDAPATKGLDAALLKNFVFREGKIAIGGEFGFGESVNRRGVLHAAEGIQNVLRHYGMLPGEIVRIDPTRDGAPVLVDARNLEDYTPCPQDGVWEPLVDLGDQVEAGQLIGRVHSFSDHSAAALEIRANRGGIMIMMCGTAQCRQGTTLFVIARPVENGA
jgi:hypothetical protein